MANQVAPQPKVQQTNNNKATEKKSRKSQASIIRGKLERLSLVEKLDLINTLKEMINTEKSKIQSQLSLIDKLQNGADHV